MPLKLVLGLAPFLSFLALCLLFYKVERKVRGLDLACLRVGLLLWGVGIWIALITGAVSVFTGQWPAAINLAHVCFSLTTAAFLEPLIRPLLR